MLIFLLALAVRLGSAWHPSFHHPDEVWQYLEPAYRLLTGRGVVTWEYREGMRSWFIPLLLAGPMALGRLVVGSDPAYLISVRVALALASLSIPMAGMAIGARISRTHAIVAGLALATSFELAYWSPRALSETIALAFLLPAVWALETTRAQPRRWAVAGCLMGLAIDCRFQVAPAAVILAIGYARRDAGAWRSIVLGGVVGLAIGASGDLAMGQSPFGWIVRNFRLNLLEHRSEDYGVLPADWYLRNQLRLWGWATIPLLVLAMLGAVRRPVLLAAALIHLAAHSIIPHKEYRFVLLSSVLLLLLAAFGTAELVAHLRAARRKLVLALLALFWVGASAATARSRASRDVFVTFHEAVDMHFAAHALAHCGVAFIGEEKGPLMAYSLYDRPTPIFSFVSPDRLSEAAQHTSEFDVAILAKPDAHYVLPGYTQRACFGPKHRTPGEVSSDVTCIYQRTGACRTATGRRFDINDVLARRGE